MNDLKVRVLVECLSQLVFAEALPHALHHLESAHKRLCRLVSAPGVGEEMAESELGLPPLNGIAQRDGKVPCGTEMMFGRVPVTLDSCDVTREPPPLHQILP